MRKSVEEKEKGSSSTTMERRGMKRSEVRGVPWREMVTSEC